jgi:hypothetical protein
MSEVKDKLINEIDIVRARARLAIEAAELAIRSSDEIILQIEEELAAPDPELEEALSVLRISGLLTD